MGNLAVRGVSSLSLRREPNNKGDAHDRGGSEHWRDGLGCAARNRIAIQNCNPSSRASAENPCQPRGVPFPDHCRIHQRQIESPQVNQHAFINIFLSAQVHTPHASRSTRQRGEIVREDPVLLELYVQLAESNLPSGSASV